MLTAVASAATTTSATANVASIAAPTVINNRNNNANNNNVQAKKIVLYNPTIDYSAPLQQQINPDIIGAHPHAQQYQQQQSSGGAASGSGATLHNTNQVRQPLQLLQQQQNQQSQQQQTRVSSFAPNVAAARVALAGLAAATTTSPNAQSTQQQQQQQLQLQQQMLATLALPLKLSEQCNLSNLHLNNFANEMSPIKSGGLDQQQQQAHNNIVNNSNNNNQQQMVGMLGRNVGSNGLLANNSVGSSISNLLISNNLPATATAVAATITENGLNPALPGSSKLTALWGQPHAATKQFSLADGSTGAGTIFANSTGTADAISSLWGCSTSSASSGASTTSGCSSGSGSQPSLSPTSIASTRPDYRNSNGKEPLWSSSTLTSPNSNNKLRDTYYIAKGGIAITTANASGDSGGQQSKSPSANSTCSSTTSSASSTCSSGVGSSSAIDVGVWSNAKLQQYFGADNSNATAAEDLSQFAKISNIWDIPNSSANTTRTTDLFWCNNTDNGNVAAGLRVVNNPNAEFDLGESVDFSDASSIWRTNGSSSGAGHPKPLTATTTPASNNNNNNKAERASLSSGGDDDGNGGVGVQEQPEGGAACMQLFSEQFLNYMNIMNYTE